VEPPDFVTRRISSAAFGAAGAIDPAIT